MNPELRRNLWLELSLHRMVAMPVFLLLALGLVAAATDDPLAKLATASAIVAGVLLGVWGSRSASECVAEEVRNRTWDGQRMSAIGPWSMAWGKLLGATAFSWYGGALALAVMLVAAPLGWHPAPFTLAALIAASSLMLQAAACLGGIAVARKGAGRRGAAGGWAVILLLFLFGPGLFGLFSDQSRIVDWWGGRYGFTGFMLASALAFAAWAVLGVYRVMAAELQARTVPWAYVVFTLFLTAYLAGFWVHGGLNALDGRSALLICGLPVAMWMTYVVLFTESTGVVVMRRVQVRFVRGEWRRMFEELPCWTAGVALAGFFALLGLAFLQVPERSPELLQNMVRAPLTLFLLLARDVAIFLFFAFSRQPRRVEAAAVFYLLLLYGVLPGLLAATGFKAAAELVLPPLLAEPGKAMAVAGIQAAIACALVTWRWRSYRNPERGAAA